MKPLTLSLAAVVVFSGGALIYLSTNSERDREPTLGQSDCIVSFSVPGGADATTTAACRVCLDIEKPGRAPLSSGRASLGGVDGCHNFPRGSTAAGVVAYFTGLLLNSGWTETRDFLVVGDRIRFNGVTRVDARCDNAAISIAYSKVD
jgi:hypothetical protein